METFKGNNLFGTTSMPVVQRRSTRASSNSLLGVSEQTQRSDTEAASVVPTLEAHLVQEEDYPSATAQPMDNEDSLVVCALSKVKRSAYSLLQYVFFVDSCLSLFSIGRRMT